MSQHQQWAVPNNNPEAIQCNTSIYIRGFIIVRLKLVVGRVGTGLKTAVNRDYK